MAEQDQLLTRGETAGELAVCVRTLERWARQGIGPPPVRMGPRAVRYRRSDITRWIAALDAITRGTR
jgi:predicted DNA-binding transcriptional regulator AlpA